MSAQEEGGHQILCSVQELLPEYLRVVESLECDVHEYDLSVRCHEASRNRGLDVSFDHGAQDFWQRTVLTCCQCRVEVRKLENRKTKFSEKVLQPQHLLSC